MLWLASSLLSMSCHIKSMIDVHKSSGGLLLCEFVWVFMLANASILSDYSLESSNRDSENPGDPDIGSEQSTRHASEMLMLLDLYPRINPSNLAMNHSPPVLAMGVSTRKY